MKIPRKYRKNEVQLPRHRKKERRGTNNEITKATHETIDAQTKKNCSRGTALERSVGETTIFGPTELSKHSIRHRRMRFLTWLRGHKTYLCSTQLSMKFLLLLNLKLLTIANSFLLNIAEHENVPAYKYENPDIVDIFIFISFRRENFLLS